MPAGQLHAKIPLDAWKDALACDPVSAYGGVIVTNTPVEQSEAEEIDKIFFEIIIAPDFTESALEYSETKEKQDNTPEERQDPQALIISGHC